MMQWLLFNLSRVAWQTDSTCVVTLCYNNMYAAGAITGLPTRIEVYMIVK